MLSISPSVSHQQHTKRSALLRGVMIALLLLRLFMVYEMTFGYVLRADVLSCLLTITNRRVALTTLEKCELTSAGKRKGKHGACLGANHLVNFGDVNK